jgi:succinoglycan biosynthesis protein ExoO
MEPDRAPTVSAVMASWNTRECIARAISSVLAQTNGDLELIVVDDASSDETPFIVESFAARDNRIRLIRLDRNRGPAHARNVAIRAARGAWVAMIDADDAWRPTRLARLLSSADNLDAVFDNLAGYDAESDAESEILFPYFSYSEMTVATLLAPVAQGSHYNFGYLKPLIRRRVLVEHDLHYDETLRTSEDLLFYLTLLLSGARTTLFDEALYVYTTPVGHVSGRTSRFSVTEPRDGDVCLALERLRQRHADKLDPAAAHAIDQRIAFLRRVGPVSAFYHARRMRNLWRMAMLFTGHAAVRRDVTHKIVERFTSPP